MVEILLHLDLNERQGLNPERTIADAAKGLRAGQSAAWPDTPCNGDIFHPLGQYHKADATTSSRFPPSLARTKQCF